MSIFDDPSSQLSRLSRVQQVLMRLRNTEISIQNSASRLALVLFYHETEVLCPSGARLGSLSTIATGHNICLTQIDNYRRRGRNYTRFLLQAGLGAFLRIGDGLCRIWECKLRVCDIEMIVEYIKEQLPVCYQYAKSLDRIAANAIISGLCACGWTLPQLSELDTPLLQEVRKHVDLETRKNDGLGETENADRTTFVHRMDGSEESQPKRRRMNKSSKSHPDPVPRKKGDEIVHPGVTLACGNCRSAEADCKCPRTWEESVPSQSSSARPTSNTINVPIQSTKTLNVSWMEDHQDTAQPIMDSTVPILVPERDAYIESVNECGTRVSTARKSSNSSYNPAMPFDAQGNDLWRYTTPLDDEQNQNKSSTTPFNTSNVDIWTYAVPLHNEHNQNEPFTTSFDIPNGDPWMSCDENTPHGYLWTMDVA
ncbi:hypothetical protein SBOR_6091 [Sclerotinia borealis F-4128]|uniref:Uncharacterized protein n=1 Tax=Sclerotinia borealis (strain F-4128) TaxID=1432307 RepID=W9CFK3_SCLBF|nr:hypothetical protein SBOR_6091 [Sclerotinia borealis F-4128]